MLTTYELISYAAVLVLFSIVVYSIAKGSPPPPPHVPWAKYYYSEKHLAFAGNLFLLSLCVLAAANLALHFGVLDASLADSIGWITDAPFMFLFFVYIAMWIRALVKLRQLGKPGV